MLVHCKFLFVSFLSFYSLGILAAFRRMDIQEALAT